jgi:uncharacterized protein YndB with AHSA1/START domain
MKLRNQESIDHEVPWVERETLVEATPEEVWEALTDDDRLSEWLAPDVELDPIEGGEIAVRDGEDERTGTVETVEEQERIAFTWTRPGEGESFVEFTIEPLPAGTRVRVVETPTSMAFGGWTSRLGRLRRSLRFAPVC